MERSRPNSVRKPHTARSERASIYSGLGIDKTPRSRRTCWSSMLKLMRASTALPASSKSRRLRPATSSEGSLTQPSPRRPPLRSSVPPPNLRPPGGTHPSAQRVADGVGLRASLFTISSLALGGFSLAPFSLLGTTFGFQGASLCLLKASFSFLRSPLGLLGSALSLFSSSLSLSGSLLGLLSSLLSLLEASFSLFSAFWAILALS